MCIEPRIECSRCNEPYLKSQIHLSETLIKFLLGFHAHLITNNNMKQYTNMVRVMDSTHETKEHTSKFIGKELEVKNIIFDDAIIALYNKDKSDYWYFNLTDVRFLTPVSFKGNRVAILDKVKSVDEWYEVTDFIKYDEGYEIVIKSKQRGTTTLTESEIQDHNFNQTKETITIGGKVFDKHDFEECVKNLKEIK